MKFLYYLFFIFLLANFSLSCIKINELYPNPYGDDNSEMPDGEWIELKNECSEEINLEGYILKDNANHKLIISDTNTYTTEIDNYLVVYMNGKSGFLNNEGFEKIMLYDSNESLIDEVSYDGSEESLTWNRVNDIWVLRQPSPNKKNIEKDFDLNSKLEIENVYVGSDKKAKFGDLLRIRTIIRRGNTTKYAVYLYLEKDGEEYSKKTSVNIMEKYRDFTITMPIQIFMNCKDKYEDGEYYVVLEGLNEKIKEKIDIKGNQDSLCQVKYKEKSCPKQTEIIVADNNYNENIEFVNITTSAIYESSDIKAERVGLYIFCFLLIMLIGYFYLKNEN